MSDSSSGESSDDSLLNSPVFQKRDRRTERASKSKLSFLDACLNGSNARTDAQRRLAEVESEHIEEQKSIDEDEESPTKLLNSESADAAMVADTTHDANNDSVSGSTPNNSATSTATAPPQKATEQKPIKSAQQNEEDYWDRVESFNSSNKAKMNDGIDADRGKLSDAMNGIDYTSETDDEDGKWNDGVGGMTSEQKRREARAKLQGLSASLGQRRMFHVANEKPKTCAYDDKAEALNELKMIVTTLQKRYRNESGEEATILRRQMLEPLNKLFKKPKDRIWDLLLRFLQRNQIISGTCAERVILPKYICHWMWNVACSSYESVGHLSTACCQNLVKMIVNEMDIDDGISFGANLTFVERFTISDLVSHLEIDCGLWLNHGPISSDDENIDHSTGQSSPSVDVYAMKNVFLLWKAAFDRDLIKLDTDNGGAALCEGATKAVTALTRMGIDPTFNLANENPNNCTDILPSLLQSLLSSLIKSTIRQITKLHSESDAKKWIQFTAERMVQACSNLSVGEEGDADHDDDDGWLALAWAVDRMTDFEYDDEEHSLDVIELKLNFAMLALKRSLADDDSSDRDDQLKQATTRLKDLIIRDDNNDATKRMLQMAMEGLNHAEVSLRYIDKNSDEAMRDHPHLLSTIILSGGCAFIGLHVSKEILERNLQLEAEEKVALAELMSVIEATCNNIKKKCTSVIAYPHLRRVKEYLTRLGKFIGSMKGKADKRRKIRHQGSLDSWRRSLPLLEDTKENDDLFEFSQDSNFSMSQDS